MDEREKDIALCECESFVSEEAYFSARPQIDTNENRRIFEAGFKRAWHHLKSQEQNNG